MSRWVRFVFAVVGAAMGSNLAADMIIQPLVETPAGFLSFLEAGDRNAVLTSLWSRIEKEREVMIAGASRYGAAREIERPSAEQSISWAASQADGPVQALAISQMPHVEEEIPLLVDFRNRATGANRVGSLANVTTAFLGETPEPPSEALIVPGLAVLWWVGRRRGKFGVR